MRYTNGFKSNFEINLKKNRCEPEKRNIAEKAKKQQNSKSNISLIEPITFEKEKTSLIQGFSEQVKDSNSTSSIFSNSRDFPKSKNPIPVIGKIQDKSQKTSEIEPNIRIANILFLIYLVTCIIAIIIIIGLLIGAFTIDPFLGWILIYAGVLISSISLIMSFILAIIGLINMQRSPGKYSGSFSAWLIIFFVLFPFISTLFSIIFG